MLSGAVAHGVRRQDAAPSYLGAGSSGLKASSDYRGGDASKAGVDPGDQIANRQLRARSTDSKSHGGAMPRLQIWPRTLGFARSSKHGRLESADGALPASKMPIASNLGPRA